MTNIGFLFLTSPLLATFLSPSVYKGLDFSLEALGELSSFTTASNKQLLLQKVDFLAGHG
jgi:hypothetical protein